MLGGPRHRGGMRLIEANQHHWYALAPLRIIGAGWPLAAGSGGAADRSAGGLMASSMRRLSLAAAARTWPSSRSCGAAGLRTSGDGTVSAATVARPSVTAADAAQTPRSISSSLVAQPRAADLGDGLLQPGGGRRVGLRERREVLAPHPFRQAGEQHPAARAAQQRQRLARLERGAQVMLRLDPVHADRDPGDQPDEDHRLAALADQVAHDRVGDLDERLGGLGGAGKRDEPRRQVVRAAVVADQQARYRAAARYSGTCWAAGWR